MNPASAFALSIVAMLGGAAVLTFAGLGSATTGTRPAAPGFSTVAVGAFTLLCAIFLLRRRRLL